MVWSFSLISLTALQLCLNSKYPFSNSFSGRKKQKCNFSEKGHFPSCLSLTVALMLITENIFWQMAAGETDWQLMKNKEDPLHGKKLLLNN